MTVTGFRLLPGRLDADGQRALAEEMTTLVHGADETAKAVAASRALFGQGDLAELDEATLAAAVAVVPRVGAPVTAEAAVSPWTNPLIVYVIGGFAAPLSRATLLAVTVSVAPL